MTRDQIDSSLRCVWRAGGGGHSCVVTIGTVVVTIEAPYNRTDRLRRIHARAPRGRYSSSVQHDM